VSRDHASLVILGGGQSRRFGSDKCLLPFGKRRLIDYVIERYKALHIPVFLVVRDSKSLYIDKEVTIIRDILEQRSSLVGLLSGLEAIDSPYGLFLAADMPFVPLELLFYMMEKAPDYDVIVPHTSTAYQPLCALYHKRCSKTIRAQLAQGDQTIYQFYPQVNTCTIELQDLQNFGDVERIFFNINTRNDYDQALIWLDRRKS